MLATLYIIILAACVQTPDNVAPTLAATAPLLPAATPLGTPSSMPITPMPLPTATAQPTTTPQPTPCQLMTHPALADAWREEELGCPIASGLEGVSTAYAPFEGGQMLWRGDTDTIYVLTNDSRWMSFPNTWQPGWPEYSCGEESSPPTPVRGFGRVWCNQPEVQAALGAVTALEIGDGGGIVQEFVNGTILTAPFGDLFVFEGEDATWRRVAVLPQP